MDDKLEVVLKGWSKGSSQIDRQTCMVGSVVQGQLPFVVGKRGMDPLHTGRAPLRLVRVYTAEHHRPRSP